MGLQRPNGNGQTHFALATGHPKGEGDLHHHLVWSKSRGHFWIRFHLAFVLEARSGQHRPSRGQGLTHVFDQHGSNLLFDAGGFPLRNHQIRLISPTEQSIEHGVEDFGRQVEEERGVEPFGTEQHKRGQTGQFVRIIGPGCLLHALSRKLHQAAQAPGQPLPQLLSKPLLDGLNGPQSLFSEPVGPAKVMSFDANTTGRRRSQREELGAVVAGVNFPATYGVQQ